MRKHTRSMLPEYTFPVQRLRYLLAPAPKLPRQAHIVVVMINGAHCGTYSSILPMFSRNYCTAMQVKPKVEAMLLEEIELSEALEESLGKDEIDKGLDAAFEAQGGEQGDISKAFPVPDVERSSYEGSGVQDAEMA